MAGYKLQVHWISGQPHPLTVFCICFVMFCHYHGYPSLPCRPSDVFQSLLHRLPNISLCPAFPSSRYLLDHLPPRASPFTYLWSDGPLIPQSEPSRSLPKTTCHLRLAGGAHGPDRTSCPRALLPTPRRPRLLTAPSLLKALGSGGDGRWGK